MFFFFFIFFSPFFFFFFFFNDTPTTEIYTLSLHDALPISRGSRPRLISAVLASSTGYSRRPNRSGPSFHARSEEHTSELQSRLHLVCRLLLEKKKKKKQKQHQGQKIRTLNIKN